MDFHPEKIACRCGSITYGDIAALVEQGVTTYEGVRAALKKDEYCGLCADTIRTFIREYMAEKGIPQLAKATKSRMSPIKQITDDLIWLGGNDRRISLFESVYPVPEGISYNAYLLMDRKTVLMDTVDKAVSDSFFVSLEEALEGRALDFVVVNHMEPDHCATLEALVQRYPEVQIVTNERAAAMIRQFFTFDLDSRLRLVAEGDVLHCGVHTLTFFMAPMVHWPETMVTYDVVDKILFSADAFGTFGALSGQIFADEVGFDDHWMAEARRYYCNIVGKYGVQVQALLKKFENRMIRYICPLHGPIWRKDLPKILEKYQKWSSYQPEEAGVLIAYASVYGHTQAAAELLACKLADAGVPKIQLYDVSVTHPSYVVAEAFRYSHVVFASTTYNGGIFVNMETLLHDLVAHNVQNRTIALIENGSWAPTSGRLMRQLLSNLKNVRILETGVTVKSALKESQLAQMDALAAAIAAEFNGSEPQSAPAPAQKEPAKKGFVCKICGYIYEGDTLPADFVCPICKKDASFFEALK